MSFIKFGEQYINAYQIETISLRVEFPDNRYRIKIVMNSKNVYLDTEQYINKEDAELMMADMINKLESNPQTTSSTLSTTNSKPREISGSVFPRGSKAFIIDARPC